MDTPFYTISWYVSDSKRRSFFKDSEHACFFGLAELFLFQNASSFTPVVEPACKYVERCKYMYVQHHLSKYSATIQYNTIQYMLYGMSEYRSWQGLTCGLTGCAGTPLALFVCFWMFAPLALNMFKTCLFIKYIKIHLHYISVPFLLGILDWFGHFDLSRLFWSFWTLLLFFFFFLLHGGLFDWSSLQMTKCQTLKRFWHFFDVIWHLAIS